ncbi:hypothetical protein ACFP67_14195 [Mammaliicoccus sciuri]|uniref:hypothetical protein n=1 Tax=Mammaliicoccus sciuri TaxID=1296 RepID=UPI000CD2A7A1|nr:hypothetical protein [Mammaliicoccus sciuri]PNZ29983.1 hypothetical protein CD114_01125 [Mammaliicoccus sciuri]
MAEYRTQNLEWKHFDKQTIVEVHGDMYYYRDLYEGNHHELFPRAQHLIQQGEIIDVYSTKDEMVNKNVRTPYLMANISKMIVDVPTTFATRSIGQVKTNHPPESIAQQNMGDEAIDNNIKVWSNDFTDEDMQLIEGTKTNDYNGNVIDLQQETLDQILKNSRINHTMNINQLQIDGGLVAVPIVRNDQISIDFKERNVYFPHDDDLGADLVYQLKQTKEEEENDIRYVHIYTERELGNEVQVSNKLYVSERSKELELVDDPAIIEEKLRLNGALEYTFKGRQRRFIAYLANAPTFMNKLGNSALKGIEGKQEEVNWTITRSAQTFERNGKPRISIPKGTMNELKRIAAEKYNDDSRIDHRFLEITEIDEQTGKSMEIHQIDTTKIGDWTYVKEIIRAMLAETQTSENAIEMVKENTSTPQSGTAKFYDLMVSIIKAEKLRDDYIQFLKESIENALWFAQQKDNNIIIEQPNIMVKDMIPQPKQELSVDNIAKYNASVQSLQETIRQNNPDKSEEWIKEEIARIKEDKSNTDSMTADRGNQTINNFLNNRDSDGNTLDEFGNPVEE